MWKALEVINYLIMLVVAVWFFAATFEPLRSRTFKRPFTPRMIIIGRVLGALCIIGTLVVLCSVVYDLAVSSRAEHNPAAVSSSRDYDKYVHVAAVEPARAEQVQSVLEKEVFPA